MVVKRIYDLIEGDRFYFVADKQRKVWILDRVEEINVSYEWQAPHIKKIVHIKDDLFGKKEVKKNQEVVYIRNSG